ncbi:coiled-coil domain-containing protein 12 [Tetranychus urticae]|uniref:coiled-coil domain-containing protein 12 n=1 Tax=Tetranychus urticae TaxID=32264 RepID=UPI00077BC088|nr:coiled-coil domain-containing protein 12 [Tetranychus urticae]
MDQPMEEPSEEPMADETVVGSLEDEAKRRKERLMAWKSKSATKDTQSGEQSKENVLPKPKFRNYNPHDESLAVIKAETGKLASVEDLIKDQLEAAKPQPVAETIDLNNLTPRKIDWDLKRNIAKKLDKLERRTKRAMAELIREKLKGEQSIKAIEN